MANRRIHHFSLIFNTEKDFGIIYQFFGLDIMIIYDRLWVTLKKKGLSQYKLIHEYGVSAGQLSRLRANESVTLHTLDMLCSIIDCRLEDIVEYVRE